MAKILEPAKPAVNQLVERIRKKHHQELEQHGVTVTALMVRCGDEDKDTVALKHHGYPAAAVISVTPYKQRVQGLSDALLLIDFDGWQRLSDAQQAALIDHELTHLVVQFDKDGSVRLDDLGRPKLKLRQHDWQTGGFEEVIDRHGAEAPEHKAFNAIAEQFRQKLLPWG